MLVEVQDPTRLRVEVFPGPTSRAVDVTPAAKLHTR
jgi:hypothetical protein